MKAIMAIRPGSTVAIKLNSQHELFLLLKKRDDHIDALKFDFLVYKYGYPNDEVGHPLF